MHTNPLHNGSSKQTIREREREREGDMGEEAIKVNLRPAAISAPPFQLDNNIGGPKSPLGTRIMTPLALGSPLLMKKAISNMQTYLEEVGHLTKIDPQESWLPITESRNGNAYYAAFHTLSSGIGVQALVLPLAFTALGWYVKFLINAFIIWLIRSLQINLV